MTSVSSSRAARAVGRSADQAASGQRLRPQVAPQVAHVEWTFTAMFVPSSRPIAGLRTELGVPLREVA